MKTAAEILATDDIGLYESVHVPEWGTNVFIRPLTAHEVDQVIAYENKHKNESDKKRCYVVIKGAVNEDGSPLFQMDQMNMLVQKNFKALKTVADAILLLSGLMKPEAGEDETDADAEKN